MNFSEPAANKTIALVEWAWVGHHPSYYRLFIKALLELGHQVVAICPKGPAETEIYEEFQTFCSSGQLSIIPCQRYSQAPRLLPRLLHKFAYEYKTFRTINRSLSKWEQHNATKLDLVFFACIYDIYFTNFDRIWKLNPRPWAGLYLHCRGFRKPETRIPNLSGTHYPCPDRFLKTPNLVALAVLDEGVTATATAMSGKPTIVFPDLTYEKVNSTVPALVGKLHRLAAGRSIVASLGHLQCTKGCGHLAQVAQRPAVQDVMFAFIGQIIWSTFNEEDIARLSKLQETLENTFTHFASVGDNDFNNVVRACDVIFAAYIDFPNSSNMLTKAAVFEKPVIVSDGSLMAERTREFRLGEIIPEGDIDAAEAAIINITKDIPGWINRTRPRWAEYRDRHSFSSLKKSFADLISQADK